MSNWPPADRRGRCRGSCGLTVSRREAWRGARGTLSLLASAGLRERPGRAIGVVLGPQALRGVPAPLPPEDFASAGDFAFSLALRSGGGPLTRAGPRAPSVA